MPSRREAASLDQELRGIFQQTLDSQLSKTERKFAKVCDAESTAAGLAPTRLEELRRLGEYMSDNVLQRIARHAESWEEERNEHDVATNMPKAERLRSEARVQELEERLREKQREVAQKQEQLFARCTSDFAAALNAREYDLLEAQQHAVRAEALAISAGGALAAARGSEVAEHMTTIKNHLAATQQTLVDLDTNRKGLKKIEALQQCGLLPIEELLAGAVADSAEDDADRRLLAAIQRGEQVCNRMRCHAIAGV